MDLKKIGLFIFLWIIGIIILYMISVFTHYMSYFFYIAIILYTILLIFILKNYSKKTLIIIILIFVVYFLINIFPFPTCDIWAQLIGDSQECSCFGIEKTTFGIIDAGGTQCIGYPYNITYHSSPF
jgi:O-antigen ligase